MPGDMDSEDVFSLLCGRIDLPNPTALLANPYGLPLALLNVIRVVVDIAGPFNDGAFFLGLPLKLLPLPPVVHHLITDFPDIGRGLR